MVWTRPGRDGGLQQPGSTYIAQPPLPETTWHGGQAAAGEGPHALLLQLVGPVGDVGGGAENVGAAVWESWHHCSQYLNHGLLECQLSNTNI